NSLLGENNIGTIDAGDNCPVTYFPPDSRLGLKIRVHGTDLAESAIAVICNPDGDPNDKILVLRDSKGNELHLNLNYYSSSSAGFASRVAISAPYIILNKTGLRLTFKTRAFMIDKEAAGQSEPSEM